METTKNKLPEKIQQFFKELSNYLDTKLLFYGSVQRNDYFPGSSDIDVDIFTDNEDAIIVKMQHFLHVKKDSFKKVVWRLNHNNQIVNGHKIMYKNKEENFSVEFSIYNEKWKTEVLKEHIKKTNVPSYASWCLVFLKFLYYNLRLMDHKTFRFLKNKLLTTCIGYPDDEFIVL
jgi:hypothetical protein